MTLAERLTEYVRACFPALWVRTHEPDDALAEIVQALESRITAGKRDQTFVVMLAPLVQIPVELERQFAGLTRTEAVASRSPTWAV